MLMCPDMIQLKEEKRFEQAHKLKKEMLARD
jgi:hypothetical protein